VGVTVGVGLTDGIGLGVTVGVSDIVIVGINDSVGIGVELSVSISVGAGVIVGVTLSVGVTVVIGEVIGLVRDPVIGTSASCALTWTTCTTRITVRIEPSIIPENFVIFISKTYSIIPCQEIKIPVARHPKNRYNNFPMASKHQQYFQDMIENNQELFDTFKRIHDLYDKDPEKYQEEFNDVGEDVLNIVRKYENMLCSHSEGGKYGKFSSKLSDKFRDAVKGKFPKIDFVGIT